VSPLTPSTWYEAQASLARRPALAFDLDVDVCVVGGGFAGLTTAHEVAKRGWSVAVLEADRIAGGASGGNCGFVMPGFSCGLAAVVERVGMAHARDLWRLSEIGVDHVRDTIRDHLRDEAMAGVDPVAGCLDVSRNDDGDAAMAELVLLGEFGAHVEGWPVERVRSVLASDHYFHAIHFPTAFHIRPLHYARGLAAAAEAAGARIFEATAAEDIDPAGVRKRITTAGGRVRAAHVVLAGNTGLGRLAPRVAETVLPVVGYVGITQPLGERLAAAIAWHGGVSDSRAGDHRYRIVDGDRLMWSGAAGVWPRDPQRVARQFSRDIARIYPQLGEVAFAHAWAARTGVAVHRMPQIGEVSPGVWLAGAFGIHGLATSAMAGRLIGAAVVDGDDRWRAFLPYELVWAGGGLGRAVAQASYWIHRGHEEVAARAARRREALQKSAG
jgi:glycine/D-amino acid oxidase-like deaminating enzyme